MNIGLLEDNLAVCEYVTVALKLMGHSVSIHTTGVSLLEVLPTDSETIPYDMVIMDLNLPDGLSGQEMVTRIHSRSSTKLLPILIISGTHEGELTRMSTRFPSIPILRKPFKFQDLAQCIDQYCRI